MKKVKSKRYTSAPVADSQTGFGNLITAAEFAKRTGMSLQWVRKQVQGRQISCVKVGGPNGRAVRIPESELTRILNERFVPAVNA